MSGEAELTPLERSLATLESRRRVFADLAGSEETPEPSPARPTPSWLHDGSDGIEASEEGPPGQSPTRHLY